MPTRTPVPKASRPEEAATHSSVRQLMQKLESLEQGSDSHGHQGHNRWMVPYADLLTLLLGLFLVLFSAAPKPTGAIAGPAAKPNMQSTQAQPAVAAQIANQQSKTSNARDLALAKQLQQKMSAHVPMQGIEIRQQERGVVISLKDSILFTPGNAELSPAARHTLDGLMQQLQKALGGESRAIRVEGHTDNSPIATSKFPSNWELSTARATTIVRTMISSHRFPPQMLSAAGYGEFKPVKDNYSIEGKQKNRRVDIVVLKPDLAQQEPPALNESTATNGGPVKHFATPAEATPVARTKD